jgi:holo-[acyl-carrier protein] synthase
MIELHRPLEGGQLEARRIELKPKSSSRPATLANDEYERRIAKSGITMIVGTGIDIAEVERIASSIERFGRRFLERVFTPDEIRYCESKANKAERYAGRFAAKEAAMKAIGTGWNRGVTWQDVEVQRAPGSRPVIAFHGKGREFFDKLGAVRAHLSISHTKDSAMAQVILESE